MTGRSCGHRKHTPIVSEKQRGLFGAEYRRRKQGKKPKIPSITRADLRSHLKEAGGKSLPNQAIHAASRTGHKLKRKRKHS
jgi:hypothetical protein